jgi:flagellar FliL protein
VSDTDETVVPTPKSGGNKMVMVVLLANLLGLGGLGAYLVMTRGESKAHAAPAPAVAPHVGPLVPVEPLIVNLADATTEADGPQYLKVTLQLEATNETSRPLVESALVPIRSRVILRLASLTAAETRGADNLVKLQGELKNLVNETLGSPRVRRVFYTEFVVQ